MTERRFLVGYAANSSGLDALRLGIALARSQPDVVLHVALVHPTDDAYAGVYPADRAFSPIVRRQLEAWLADALAQVPEGIEARGEIVAAPSDAEGLMDAAARLQCDAIIVGGRRGGILRRHRVGSVAQTLLHAASVPVVLAPAGYMGESGIDRVTTMFGTRAGSTDVIGTGVEIARRRGADLRLVSLLVLDGVDDAEPDPTTQAMNLQVLQQVTEHGDARLAAEAQELVEADRANTVIATGSSVEDALDRLDWRPGELIVVGSSRLAARGRLFVGQTAARMLRTVSVPIVVVPAGGGIANADQTNADQTNADESQGGDRHGED